MLRKINKKRFIKAYRKTNDDNLTEKQVAKNGGINYSYLHAALSIGQGTKRVSEKLARRIGRGLGMSKQFSTIWVNNLCNYNISTSAIANATIKHQLQKGQPTHKARLERPKHLPIVFYPDNKPSKLAQFIKDTMADKHISLKGLSKVTFLNKKRMHDIFNGTAKPVSYLTCVRIADGLNVPVGKIHGRDSFKQAIKEQPLFKATKANNSASLEDKIELLSNDDKQLVNQLVDRLITAERK